MYSLTVLRSTAALEEKIARRISFVPQDSQIGFEFTVAEILEMGRYAHRGRCAPPTATDRAAVNSAAAYCDITHLTGRLITTLSGGERQRVLIARSLVAEPEFILLDEPTANLDIQHALDILDLCQALARQGKTIVVATHDVNLVTRYATRLALLNAGSLIAQGPRGHGASSGNPQRRLSCLRGTYVNKSGRSGVCVSPASGRVVTRLRRFECFSAHYDFLSQQLRRPL